jgi:hypothetical protein
MPFKRQKHSERNCNRYPESFQEPLHSNLSKMDLAAFTPAADAWARLLVTPAPSPTANSPDIPVSIEESTFTLDE